jgi:hypothetical protein
MLLAIKISNQKDRISFEVEVEKKTILNEMKKETIKNFFLIYISHINYI